MLWSSVLCRKYPKHSDNEPIQCEDCQTNATIFYWAGKFGDVILCDECFKEEQSKKGKGREYEEETPEEEEE